MEWMMKRVAKIGTLSSLSKADQAELTAFRKAAKAHVDKVLSTRKTAKQELIDAGIYGKDGKLRKHYRSVA